jgi:hypothetical protein
MNTKRSRKTIRTLAATAAIILGCSSASYALPKEGIGIGIIAGEPTGISLKSWTDNTHAIDGAIALSLSDSDAFQVHADYLIHNFSSLNTSEMKGSTPWYYGLGGRLRSRSGDTHFGVRVPVGINYLFADSPFDFFAEVAPVIDIAPKAALDLNGAIGLRFFIK